jgi:hypothetical protein
MFYSFAEKFLYLISQSLYLLINIIIVSSISEYSRDSVATSYGLDDRGVGV